MTGFYMKCNWNGLISKKKYLHIFGLVTLTFTKLDKLDLIRCSPKIFLQWLFKKLSKDLRESTLGRFSIKKNVFMDPQTLTHPEKNVSWFFEVSVTSLFYSFLGLGKPAAKTIFHKVEGPPQASNIYSTTSIFLGHHKVSRTNVFSESYIC